LATDQLVKLAIMSSKPTPQGVAKTITILKSIHELHAECERLAPIALRLRAAREELSKLKMMLEDQLRSMDVEETGNAGWESRFGWFLGEFLRQAVETPDHAMAVMRVQAVDQQALDTRRYRRLRAEGVKTQRSACFITGSVLDGYIDDNLAANPDGD
jgi:hypothetical protein